jgi:hypothetical protein
MNRLTGNSQRTRRHPNHIVLALLCMVMLSTLAAGPGAAGKAPPDVQPPPGVRGEAAIAHLGDRLPAVAAAYGNTAEELQRLFEQDLSLWLDATGHLVYICDFGGFPTAAHELAVSSDAASAPYPYGQTFLLHSRPGASKVIYLDFDGHTTAGTLWNSNYNNGQPIVSAPFDLDGNPSTFSTAEMEVVQYVWQRVAEDFIIYDVDVTTQDPGVEALRKTDPSDPNYGQRVVISATNWYNANAGGVAYLGSFNWDSDTPCYAFAGQLANSEKGIAEAASHETGHTLGLHHDGTTTGVEYYQGHGNWAPIMGTGYYKEIVQWSKGEYANANNHEDDLAIMPNYGVSYRNDDHSDSTANATPLHGTVLSASGIIERGADTDVFSFATGAGSITIGVDPAPRSPNLDILAQIRDSQGNLVASSNLAGLAASITANVPAGTYYLSLDGVGTGDPTTGYSDYGSLGQYTISGTVVEPGNQQTPTATVTLTATQPATPTATRTSTFTATATATHTSAPTATTTRTITPTATATVTASATASPTVTATTTGTPTGTPNGSISGVVAYDTDGNGVLGGNEPGLAGVNVVLLQEGRQVGQQVTAGDGSYSFTSLPAGEYMVRESQPEWLRYSSTPDEVTLRLAVGQRATVNFGDWNGLPAWLPLVVR